MHKASAFETIMFLAAWTSIICQFFIEWKYSFAAWCWAPSSIHHILINIILENELLILLCQLFCQKFFNFIISYLNFTLFWRANYRETLINDVFFSISLKALFVIHMSASKKTKRFHINLSNTNRALCS